MLMPSHSTSAPSVQPEVSAGKSRGCWPAWMRPRIWLPTRLQHSWREFNEHLTHDQAFADAISRRLDVAAAIFLFSSYTLCAVLIFSINGSIYGNNN